MLSYINMLYTYNSSYINMLYTFNSSDMHITLLVLQYLNIKPDF